MSLPETLNFGTESGWPRPYFYEVVREGKPRKGEWFVSGAIPEAHFAPNDLDDVRTIVRPTHKAERVTVFKRGDAVKFFSNGKINFGAPSYTD